MAIYLIGRIIWCNLLQSNLLGWLFRVKPSGEHSYLYGWLNFPDILPESVLRHYGFDRRPEGKLGESALYSLKRDRSDLKSLREERKNVRDQMRPKLETFMGKQIREKIERDNVLRREDGNK